MCCSIFTGMAKPQKRLSLKYFHDEYILYKEEEKASMLKRKRNVLSDLYDSYARDYEDSNYVYDGMMEAINNCKTEIPVFYETEDPDICLWDNDLEDLFAKPTVDGLPALGSLLTRQLSDEFRLHLIGSEVHDYRDDTKYKTIEIFLQWGVKEEEEEEEEKEEEEEEEEERHGKSKKRRCH